jgi:multidrug efflux pump subunit AcrB
MSEVILITSCRHSRSVGTVFRAIPGIVPTVGSIRPRHSASQRPLYTSAAINGNSAPGVSSGDVARTVNAIARQMDVPFEWTALTYLEQQAGYVGYLVFALGTVIVYLVLAAKYE